MTIEEIIIQALKEDIAEGDHTSLSCIPSASEGRAKLLVKEEGIIAGVDVARQVFQTTDNKIQFEQLIPDGTRVKPGDIIFFVNGKAISLLKAERLALNFMQRMSGIATTTNRYVTALKGLKTKVLDTRKTSPNLRNLEKMAVRIGGGFNHRMGLYDMILIKDNHIDFAGGIEKAILSAQLYVRKIQKQLKIEIEARNLDEVKKIISCGGIHRIMLDNFTIPDLKKAVRLINNTYETEASGGITLKNARKIAETGVDYISVGALTHHISSLDLSLKAVKEYQE